MSVTIITYFLLQTFYNILFTFTFSTVYDVSNHTNQVYFHQKKSPKFSTKTIHQQFPPKEFSQKISTQTFPPPFSTVKFPPKTRQPKFSTTIFRHQNYPPKDFSQTFSTKNFQKKFHQIFPTFSTLNLPPKTLHPKFSTTYFHKTCSPNIFHQKLSISIMTNSHSLLCIVWNIEPFPSL